MLKNVLSIIAGAEPELPVGTQKSNNQIPCNWRQKRGEVNNSLNDLLVDIDSLLVIEGGESNEHLIKDDP